MKKTSLRMLLSCLVLLLMVSSCSQGVKSTWESNGLRIQSKEISISNGAFCIHLLVNEIAVDLKPDGPPVISQSERETPVGPARVSTYTWTHDEGYEYALIVSQIGTEVISLRVSLTNASDAHIRIGYIDLLNTPEGGFSVTGEASQWMLASTDMESRRWGPLDADIPTENELVEEKAYSRKYLRMRGDPEKNKDRKWRGYFDDMTLYTEPGKLGLSVAAVDTISDVYIDVKAGSTSMKLEVDCNMSEILVDPGECRTSDEVLFMFLPWAEAQQMRNHWIAEVAGVRIKKAPIFGWCSWYRSGSRVKEEDIYNIAAYTKQHRNLIPFDVIQIDDGWQKGMDDWTENEKFTSGLENISASIKSSGAMAGIWLCPVRVDPVKDEQGNSQRVFPPEWYCNYNTGKPDMAKLDPTRPEAREFMRKSLKYSLDRGFNYFKLDFSKLPYDAKRFHDQKLTRFQAQRELFRLFRETIGEENYLLSCGISDQRSLVPFIDAARIGTDTGPRWGFSRKAASDGKPGEIHGYWFPIHSMANVAFENGVLSNTDPDVAYLGLAEECQPRQLLTFHSYMGLAGGFRMVSTYLFEDNFDKRDHLRLLEIHNKVPQEKGYPFSGGWDMAGKEFGYATVRPWGNSVNMLLWNPEHSGTADLSMKNVPNGGIGEKYHAWSFWDEKYLGEITNEYLALEIPPYEHQLLKLSALSEEPVLIGSNLSISMGAAEVLSMDQSQREITIELDPEAGCRDGRLYFHSEQPLGEVSSTNSHALLMKQEKHLYVLVLSDRKKEKKEIITIQKSGGDAPELSVALMDEQIWKKYEASTLSKNWETSW